MNMIFQLYTAAPSRRVKCTYNRVQEIPTKPCTHLGHLPPDSVQLRAQEGGVLILHFRREDFVSDNQQRR